MKEEIRKRDTGTIKLIAVNNKYRNVPFFATPIYDAKRRKYRLGGQEDMTLNQLSKCALKISEDEHYPVSHNEVLDLSDPVQKEKVCLLYDQDPYIVVGSTNVKPGETLFYIEDRETEAVVENTFYDDVLKAMQIIAKSSVDDYKDMCMLLGLPSKGSKNVMEHTLKLKAMKEPKKIIKLKEGDFEERLFILKLIDKGVLTKSRKDNRIYDGQSVIARNLDDAVLFIKDEKNAVLLDSWRKTLS